MMRLKLTVIGVLAFCIQTYGLRADEINGSEKVVNASLKSLPMLQEEVIEVKEGPTPGSSERNVYRKGRITEKLSYWNHQPWEVTRYEYIDQLSRYSVKSMVYHGDRLYIVRKDLFNASKDDNRPDQIINTWYYNFDKERANTLRQVDIYWPGTHLVEVRHVFNEAGDLTETAHFEYNLDSESVEPDEFGNIDAATRMTLVDDYGKIVSDYCEKTDVDLPSLYRQQNLSEDEIARRERISRDATRTPILVLDGGIDINHPDLAYKLWKNPIEISNGRDDDGNGLTDDIYGVSDNPRLGHPVHDLRLPRFGLPAFSHGTLVASIAAHGREDAAIMAASEMTNHHISQILPKIEQFILCHGVRYTNMSFIFDKQILDGGARAQWPHHIKRLIQNTPQTLHVVAAGNGAPINGKGFNVDRLRKDEDLVPVMLPSDNILVVGALDTDRLHLPDYPTYQLASFSNVGESSVDILAPGTRMCGARMGGGTICEDGTSFAAPYVLNHGVLNVAKANPDLDIYEIKEILMKTAYVPDLENPFPVRSGGIVHPQRAVAAARWLAQHPTDSINTAVVSVRRIDPFIIPGERNDAGYLGDLQYFWDHRGIGNTPQWYAWAETDNKGLDKISRPGSGLEK